MDVQKWIEEAQEALEERDYRRAQRVAERIIGARHSYGFELLARVFQEQDNLPRAIAVLQEGVAKAPRAWPLWMLLGELRSDHGEYDQALLAYDTALALPGVDADEVHLNAAIVHDRAGRPEDALMRLHEVRGSNPELAIQAARVRAQILLDTERPDAAAAAARAGLALVTEGIPESDIAPLYAALAKALWLKGEVEPALHYAWEAVEHHAEETALWLIREIEGEYSDSAKYFRILVHGRWYLEEAEGEHVDGFWRKYDVVADDEEEAMRLIARIEREDVRDTLRSDELEIVDPDASDQPKGVYWCSGYAFYEEREE
ncbi:MAG TPA: tetratricopeptide repeat protein [Thermoanaerobaculia bacterium]|nr:tetratricopeptide repeat protein [Thermoanaerobaculia bacterium]